jgi:hypothetical protein
MAHREAEIADYRPARPDWPCLLAFRPGRDWQGGDDRVQATLTGLQAQ